MCMYIVLCRKYNGEASINAKSSHYFMQEVARVRLKLKTKYIAGL